MVPGLGLRYPSGVHFTITGVRPLARVEPVLPASHSRAFPVATWDDSALTASRVNWPSAAPRMRASTGTSGVHHGTFFFTEPQWKLREEPYRHLPEGEEIVWWKKQEGADGGSRWVSNRGRAPFDPGAAFFTGGLGAELGDHVSLVSAGARE